MQVNLWHQMWGGEGGRGGGGACQKLFLTGASHAEQDLKENYAARGLTAANTQ